MEPGLYVCATPIGNLGDVSRRLRECLEKAEVVAHESPRNAKRLLSALGILQGPRPIRDIGSPREEKEARRVAEEALIKPVALVSDAGTPCISDPGARVVESAHAKGARVITLPGPSAATAATAASGADTGTGVTFLGFLPRKRTERRRRLATAGKLAHAVVAFEGPGRVKALLEDALEVGFTEACLCRELTKAHEEVIRGGLDDLLEHIAREKAIGEVTLVLHPSSSIEWLEEGEEGGVEAFVSRMVSHGISPSQASKRAAHAGLSSRRAAYQHAVEARRRGRSNAIEDEDNDDPE